MNKIIFTIFSFAFFTALNASGVFACSCVPRGSESVETQVKEAYTNSTAVFVGKVVEVVKRRNSSFVTVRFRVEKSWNNEKFQKEITVSTGSNDGICGYSFEAGKKYLVYASGGNNKLSTNICTRTSAAGLNKDIAFLNKIKKAKIKSSPK